MVYKVKEETIDGIANAIRAKNKSTKDIKVEDFAAEILNIETGENTVAASQSARDAEVSAISAASSAQSAMEDAESAAAHVESSKAWAIGVRNDVEVSDGDETFENNAKYYSEIAGTLSVNTKTYLDSAIDKANEAASFANDAANSAKEAKECETKTKENLDSSIKIIEDMEGFTSESWAIGTKNGIPVEEGDETYNNNAKYWSQVAKDIIKDFHANGGVANIFVQAVVTEEEST